eukprot:7385654-Prymnesium_polylepis.1
MWLADAYAKTSEGVKAKGFEKKAATLPQAKPKPPAPAPVAEDAAPAPPAPPPAAPSPIPKDAKITYKEGKKYVN